MNNDDTGIADDPRPRQQPEVEGVSPRLNEEGENGIEQAEDCPTDSSIETSDRRLEEVINAAEVLESITPEELEKFDIIREERSISQFYAGALPHPEIYYKFKEEDRERMCRWNDAFTIDESARQNCLVNNEVSQAKRSQIISALLILISWVFSLMAYGLSNNAWFAVAFLSVSVITVLGNLLKPVFSKSSRQDSEHNTD